MGGKKGSASTKPKRNKKQAKQVHSGGSSSRSKKQAPRQGQFVSLEDEIAAVGLRVSTIYGQEIEHHKVRAVVVQYMQDHSDMFSPFVEDDEGFDRYIARMKKETTWAGHMEVQAASLCYTANICIYQSGQPTWRVINFTPVDSHRCLHLSYHDGDHYNSVRGKNDPGDGPAKPISLQACIDHIENYPAQVKDVLRECGGNVDDATELLITRMASVDAENVRVCTPADDEKTTGSRVSDLQNQLPIASKLRNPPDSCDIDLPNRHVSIELEIHDDRVNLRVSQKAEGVVSQQVPRLSSGPNVADQQSTKTASKSSLKRNKVQGPGIAGGKKPSNNKPCPCNSGRRYKHCCKSRNSMAPEANTPNLPDTHALLKQLESLDI